MSQDIVWISNDSLGGFTINGRGFPATAPIVATLGDKILIRFMNEGVMMHPWHLHGMPMRVVARDGYDLGPAAFTCDTLGVNPGERWDVVIDCDEPGAWAFHCHILPHAEGRDGMFGMVTALVVQEPSRQAPRPRPCDRPLPRRPDRPRGCVSSDERAAGHREQADAGDRARRIRRILLATDLSPASRGATDQALQLARDLRATLLVVSVIDPTSPLAVGAVVVRMDQRRAAREAAAQAIVVAGRQAGVSVRFLVWEGEPGPAIVEAAAAERADLVIVGSRGRNRVERLVLGSVSDHVVRHAPAPSSSSAADRGDDPTAGRSRGRVPLGPGRPGHRSP